jgi:TonB-dependent SusC/RagA subfamily outer membrane receptor
MKLTMTLLLFAILSATAGSTYSQSARINLKMKDASLVDVFREIERNSEFGFFFKSEELDLNKQVSIDLKNATIDEILEKILVNNYSYRILDKNIIVTRSATNISDQQQKSVSGKVTDSSGASLPGVSVVLKGTTTGVLTDGDGKYTLSKVPENATLQFSFVGMKQQEIKTENQTIVNIILLEETIGIEEVVAVGYGVQKKVNLTGSISTVKFDDALDNRPITNGTQALGGKVSGVWVSQNSGKPGSDGAQLRVRGWGTMNNSNPLVIIDGVEGSFEQLNPNDIESMSVLKDAASAAIYGSKAANGVILITTKQGKNNEKMEVNLSSYMGVQS